MQARHGSQTSIDFYVINDCMVNGIQINLTVLDIVYPFAFDTLALSDVGICDRLNIMYVCI